MTEEGSPESERLLLAMHNYGVVHERASKTIQELVQLTKISVEQLAGVLREYEESGYVKSFTDSDGLKRYYLTGMGMIRVSSAFT
jgi:predicted transcriptional regulator